MQECYRVQGMLKDTPCANRQKSAVNKVTDGNKFPPQVTISSGQNIPPQAVILDGSQNTSGMRSQHVNSISWLCSIFL